MPLVFELPIGDNGTYPHYDRELTALCDYLLQLAEKYERTDIEMGHCSPTGRTEFARVHRFALSNVDDRQADLCKRIDDYVQTQFGKRPTFFT